MMAKYPAGVTGVKTRTVLSALTVFFTFCVVFSSLAFAQEAEQATPESTAIEGADTTESASSEGETDVEAIQKANGRCLRCHTRERTKTLEDGTELSIQIHREDFMGSAHGEVACTSCHEAIGNRRHPSSKTNTTIASQRNFALEMNESCRKCHADNYTQYEGSIHSSLVAEGSENAPVCSDCHSAHAIETMATYQAETGLPCKKCHDDVYVAYRESVHGSARLTGNVIRDEHIKAPICSDCHSSHQVVAMEIGDTLRSQCFGCHENVPLLHSQWLPNAGTHLDVVSCAVCHSPFAKHRFDFHFYDNETQKPVAHKETNEMFQQKLAEFDTDGGNIDPLAVWKLIEESNQSSPANISLRGRLEVQSGIWAHQIAPKSFAVRTCDSCHLAGHRQRMGVTVSVPQQDGRVQTIEADRSALSSIDQIESMSDFYELGGNRNKLLDIMFLLALFAGIAIPIGHFTLGRMIKEKLDRGEL